MYDTGYNRRFPVDLHRYILDAVGGNGQLSAVEFCSARRYPFEPFIPIQHVSGSAIYVNIVFREERLQGGDIGC